MADDTKLQLMEKARKELNENSDTRIHDLELFRTMVAEDVNLNCPMDDEFLLKFLRGRKFDHKSSLKLLQNYYYFRYNNNDIYSSYYPSAMEDQLKENMMVLLHDKDKLGRFIGTAHIDRWDTSRFTFTEVFRLITMWTDSVSDKEECQINGVIALIDVQGYSLAHFKYVTPNWIKKTLSFIQDSFPIRLKAVHIINVNILFQFGYKLLKPFLKPKIKNRMYLYGNDFKSLHNHLDPEILPIEFGGNISTRYDPSFAQMLLKDNDIFIERSKYGYRK